MTRSLSSMILSLIEDLYLFSMMLWVVLLSPSFTTPPGPSPPAVTWHWSMLGLAVLWQEPGCICLIGSLSPPPIITGTVVRMLLLISVWRTKTNTKTVFSLNHNLCLHENSSVESCTVHTGTCRAVLWMGVVRVVMPAGLCMVDSTCVPSGLRVVRTSESVLRIWGCWTKTWVKTTINWTFSCLLDYHCETKYYVRGYVCSNLG